MFFPSSFLGLSLLATLALANPYQSRKAVSARDCKSSEFFYAAKSCCLPHGGPPKRPSPPPQKQCPPSNWYWSPENSCCVPSHPLPPSKPNHPSPPPPPQCNKNWEWNRETQCCEPYHPSHPVPPPPKPSSKPGGGYGRGSNHWKRFSGKSRDVSFCPSGFEACPMSSPLTSSGQNESECVDTYSDLTSCGGCASLGKGQNCATIPGAWNVGCEVGQCKIYTCAVGYKLSSNECLPF